MTSAYLMRRKLKTKNKNKKLEGRKLGETEKNTPL